jgi:hypothetical protein
MAGFIPTAYYRQARYFRPSILTAYWTLGEDPTETTSLGDVGRYGFHATTFATGFSPGAGPALIDLNTSCHIDTANGYIDFPASDIDSKIDWSHDPFSFDFWFAADTAADWGSATAYLLFRANFTDGAYIQLRTTTTANQIALDVYDGSSTVTVNDTIANTLSPVHFTLTFDPNTFKFNLYVNGTAPGVAATSTANTFDSTLTQLRLGGTSAFNGYVGHFKVWGSYYGTLSEGEIGILSNSGILEADPATDAIIPDQIRGDVVKARLVDKATSILVAELDIEEAKVRRDQDDAGSWSFTSPIFMPDASRLEDSVRAYLLLNGVTVMDGVVRKVGYSMGTSGLQYSVSGLGEMSDLADIRGKSDAQYEDITLIAVLNDLLSRASGWAVGDVSTMVDKTATVTLDMREEERLLAQIAKAIKAVNSVYYRYGGVDVLGNRLIDIGAFGDVSNIQLEQVQDANAAAAESRPNWGGIVDFKREEDRSNVLNQIEAYGGTYEDGSGDTVAIDLADALAADPSLATDLNYPVINTSNGYVVRSAANYPDTGSEILKVYDDIVPADDTNPTSTQIETAGLALYQAAVADLQNFAFSEDTYSAEVVGLSVAKTFEIDPNFTPSQWFELVRNGTFKTTDAWSYTGISAFTVSSNELSVTPDGTGVPYDRWWQVTNRPIYSGETIKLSFDGKSPTGPPYVTIDVWAVDDDNPTSAYSLGTYQILNDGNWHTQGPATVVFGTDFGNLRLEFRVAGSAIAHLYRNVSLLHDPADYNVPGFKEVGYGVLPLIGDEIPTVAKQTASILNPAFGIVDIDTAFAVNERLRLLSYEVGAGQSRETRFAMSLSTGKYRIPPDPIVQIWDELKPKRRKLTSSVLALLSDGLKSAFTTAGTGVAADTTLDDGTAARLITVAVPAAPGGATDVTLAATPEVTAGHRWEYVTLPAWPATGLTVAVAGALPGEDWTTADQATVTALFLFT